MITLCGKPNMVRSEKEQLKKVERKKELKSEDRDLMVYMAGFENLALLLSGVQDKDGKQ